MSGNKSANVRGRALASLLVTASVLIGTVISASDDVEPEVIYVEAFRSKNVEIPLRLLPDERRCKGKAVVPDSESEPLRIRIRCTGGDGGPKWTDVPAQAFAARRFTDRARRNKLELMVGDQTFIVATSYFKLADTTRRPLPPCSAFSNQARTMGAAQGSGQPLCVKDP